MDSTNFRAFHELNSGNRSFKRAKFGGVHSPSSPGAQITPELGERLLNSGNEFRPFYLQIPEFITRNELGD